MGCNIILKYEKPFLFPKNLHGIKAITTFGGHFFSPFTTSISFFGKRFSFSPSLEAVRIGILYFVSVIKKLIPPQSSIWRQRPNLSKPLPETTSDAHSRATRSFALATHHCHFRQKSFKISSCLGLAYLFRAYPSQFQHLFSTRSEIPVRQSF